MIENINRNKPNRNNAVFFRFRNIYKFILIRELGNHFIPFNVGVKRDMRSFIPIDSEFTNLIQLVDIIDDGIYIFISHQMQVGK